MKHAIVSNKEQRIELESILKKQKIKARFEKELTNVKNNDEIYILSWAMLGKSMKDVLESIKSLNQRNILINIINSNTSFTINFNKKQLEQLINIILNIKYDLMSTNVKKGLANSIHKPKGKPKGIQNKTLKLDQYRDQIEKMVKNNVGICKIARTLNVKHQRVRYYIEKRIKNS